MRFLRLGQKRWTVLALMVRNTCPVLDLLQASGRPGIRVLSDLREWIPSRGPPKNAEHSKLLRDGVFELREPVTRGGTLRVLYFYDAGQVVVCANACLKKQHKTPESLITDAIAVRNEYRAAKLQGAIRIVDPEA